MLHFPLERTVGKVSSAPERKRFQSSLQVDVSVELLAAQVHRMIQYAAALRIELLVADHNMENIMPRCQLHSGQQYGLITLFHQLRTLLVFDCALMLGISCAQNSVTDQDILRSSQLRAQENVVI